MTVADKLQSASAVTARLDTPALVRDVVLVADDDFHLRRLLVAALRQVGFVQVDAVSGLERLERGTSASRIDLGVANLFPPEMFSANMARRWRLEQPRLEALCLTANESGLFDAYLHKPVTLNGVWDAVESLFHADITPPCDLRRTYSMAFAEVSDELRAQARDLFAPFAQPRDVEVKSFKAVIQIFAELSRDDLWDVEMSEMSRLDCAHVPDGRRLIPTWQFAQLEKCWG